jgi:hypothetical protein
MGMTREEKAAEKAARDAAREAEKAARDAERQAERERREFEESPAGQARAAFEQGDGFFSLYSAVKARRFGRSGPDALEEVLARSSCPAMPVRSLMFNVTVEKILFSPYFCHSRFVRPRVSHQFGREGPTSPRSPWRR